MSPFGPVKPFGKAYAPSSAARTQNDELTARRRLNQDRGLVALSSNTRSNADGSLYSGKAGIWAARFIDYEGQRYWLQ